MKRIRQTPGSVVHVRPRKDGKWEVVSTSNRAIKRWESMWRRWWSEFGVKLQEEHPDWWQRGNRQFPPSMGCQSSRLTGSVIREIRTTGSVTGIPTTGMSQLMSRDLSPDLNLNRGEIQRFLSPEMSTRMSLILSAPEITRYAAVVRWVEDDQVYCGEIREFGRSLCVYAKTPGRTLARLYREGKLLLCEMRELGEDVPAPGDYLI